MTKFMDPKYCEAWQEGYEWYNTPPLQRKHKYCPYEWGTWESIGWNNGLTAAKIQYLHPEND